MATARLIAAEIYNFSPPPQHVITESVGIRDRIGTSVVTRSVVSLSAGQRDTSGFSIKMGVATAVIDQDPIETVVTGITLTMGLL